MCTARGEISNPCKQCGWDPDAETTPKKTKSEPYGKFAAMVIGILTFLPTAYIFFFVTVVSTAAVSARGFDQESFMFLFFMHIGVIVLTWCLIGFYIYYLFKTDHVKQDQKALWAVVLFLGNMLALPIFWYLYIWKPTNNSL